MAQGWRRFAVVAVLVALVAVPVAVAGAHTPPVPSGTAASASQAAQLSVGVEVLKFNAAGRGETATGLVTARLTDNRGNVRTVRSRVALTAAAGRGCRVLHLFLDQLNLQLLGLTAHLDRVQLDITGNARGGVLGSLFCKLAHARVAAARAAAAHALTQRVRRGHGHALRFTAQLRPVMASSAAAGTTCPVLDLVVGPLDLQLLGLVVDLNRVHLSITATRGQGVLGDTFCQLADNSTTTTTTSTSTATTT